VVIACTGHALAAGALTLLSADYRVGARGAFKVGLNETSIGMTLPGFAIELARGRISKRHFTRATAQAEIYTPDTAIDAGYLDDVADPENLEEVALEAAQRLLGLDRNAFASTKLRGESALAEAVRSSARAELGDG
jgi:enoyl-CoA hydratase